MKTRLIDAVQARADEALAAGRLAVVARALEAAHAVEAGDFAMAAKLLDGMG